MLSAICWICFLEWVRGLCGCGLIWSTATKVARRWSGVFAFFGRSIVQLPVAELPSNSEWLRSCPSRVGRLRVEPPRLCTTEPQTHRATRPHFSAKWLTREAEELKPA